LEGLRGNKIFIEFPWINRPIKFLNLLNFDRVSLFLAIEIRKKFLFTESGEEYGTSTRLS